MTPPVLILPGFGNSGPHHWQTIWGLRHPDWQRVDLGQWDSPVCDEWVRRLDVAVKACPSPPILVAHSLACLLVAHWASRSALAIEGAFLVAVPDPQSECFPATARGFESVPMEPFAFRSLVVASANDSFGSLAHAKDCAIVWGSSFVDIGQAGHINADSGHGAWTEGSALLEKFMANRLLKMPASFVLSSSKSSTYPRGYVEDFDEPAALLDEHFEQPAGAGFCCFPCVDE